MRIILASNSPRRRELLSGLGLEYEVRTLQGIDESYPQGLAMEEIPQYISRKKAAAYSLKPDELLITADTIVWLDGEVLGKPADEEDARRMLRKLSARTHTVVTGVTLTYWNEEARVKDEAFPAGQETGTRDIGATASPSSLAPHPSSCPQPFPSICQVTFPSVSQVTFAQLTDSEIDRYVAQYRPLDKAGAYGIQEWIGYIGIASIEGSYFNVMGLPVQRLYTELKKRNFI